MEIRIEQGNVWGLSPKAAGGAQITLEPGETLCLTRRSRGFRVQSGLVWVTWRGEDIVLRPGETLRFARGGGCPVVSTAGKGRVVVQMLN